MIYTGGGVILNDAAPQLTELVRMLDFPCTNTLMGLGGYPATDRQFVGMLGMHGTYEANMAMQHCDVLVAVGARFDDRVIGNPKHFFNEDRKIIHIDIDPSSISKRVKVDVPIVGSVSDVLGELIKQLKVRKEKPDQAALEAWWAQIDLWRARNCLKYDRASPIIKPQSVIEKLYEVTEGDAFVTSDVGQHQMWAAQFYKFDRPRRWINSGGLGTHGIRASGGNGRPACQSRRESSLRDRRSQYPDVHSGTVHMQTIQPAHQDYQFKQPLYGNGAAVAGILPWQPLRRIVYGCAA